LKSGCDSWYDAGSSESIKLGFIKPRLVVLLLEIGSISLGSL